MTKVAKIFNPLHFANNCPLCNKQMPEDQEFWWNGRRYCSELCQDIMIERNPVERDEEELIEMED